MTATESWYEDLPIDETRDPCEYTAEQSAALLAAVCKDLGVARDDA